MDTSPKVSVIVPLYNRAKFLPQLFSTLSRQTFRDFEAILVDDGSTDDTASWIQNHKDTLDVPVTYLNQENAGPYAARNTGLSVAKGQYIAFQDSDDEWPDYHLNELVAYLDSHSDVDLVFGSIQRIKHDTREVVNESNFYLDGKQLHPILSLKAEHRAELKVIRDDNFAPTAILYGLPGSTQCTLYRREIFEQHQFDPSYRSIFDRFFGINLVIAGYTVAYVDKTHQIYHIHDQHVSLVAGASPEKREKSALTHIRGYRELIANGLATQKQVEAANFRLAKFYAYHLAPALLEQNKKGETVGAFWNAFKLEKSNPRYLKYLLVAFCRLWAKG